MELLLDHLSALNWWAVVVATVVAMFVGSVWYARGVFGKPWLKAIGLSEKKMQSASMAQPMVFMVVATFVTAVAMGVLVQVLDLTTAWQGATFGILVAVTLLGTNKVMQSQFEQRPLSYNVITTAADVVTLALMAAILAVWR